MCIAILKQQNETIKKAKLKNCFYNNDDGAGYMFSKDGILHFFKGFFTFKDFWKSYVKNVINNGNPISAIHFRISTHGKTNTNNCHPFRINDDIGFIHNGIIRMVETDKKQSDTSMFNDTILKRLPSNFIRNTGICDLIEESIGTSKLVFLDNKGQYLISNESLGHWDGNVWYSNDSYRYQYFYYAQPVVAYKKQPVKVAKSVALTIGNIDYSHCGNCQTPLLTRYTQNSGYCSTCETMPYSG